MNDENHEGSAMRELSHHKMKDGSTIAIMKDDEEGKYTVSQFDKGDIEMWFSEFDNADEAWTEYFKRTER